MSGAGFYALGNLWLFALVGPLVLFYFLKLKRPRLVVPSLALWRKVIEDRRVNSPFQRFKRNILLLLQILALLLLIFAALQPFLRRSPSRARYTPVLIDCSASMAALDRPAGASRLQAAKEQVSELIDNLLPDQELCLVAFGQSARRLTDFTGNKRILRDALASIAAEDIPSDIENALRMTAALARSVPFDEVMLFSDGNFPARAHFDLPFRLTYRLLPPAGANLGITSASAVRGTEGEWDVFVRVEGSPGVTGAATLEVRRDGELAAADHLSAGPEGERLAFRIGAGQLSTIEVRLVPAGPDSLSSDNAAFLALPAIRPLDVYVPASMGAYRRALRGVPDVRLLSREEASRSGSDLLITDMPEDRDLPARTRFYVGMVPDELSALISVAQEGSSVVDWDRSAPLLRHVELAEVAVLDQPRFAEGVTESDLENRGYEVLVHGSRGPLLLQERREEGLAFHLLFHTDRSTLPYRVGFPIMVSNLVRAVMYECGLAEVRAGTTGVLAPLRVAADSAFSVQGPDGSVAAVRSNPAGTLSGIAAPRAGCYRILKGGREVARVGASLLSPEETSLARTETIQFDEDLSVRASAEAMRVDRPLWPVLAVLALCVLLAEWWYFHRGAGGTIR